MKDKILAILAAPTDVDIKADLIEEFTKICCEDYLIFSANRNELIVGELGIMGFVADCKTVTQEQIWNYFKKYLKDKL